MKWYKIAAYTIFLTCILIILVLVIIKLLGYSFNKDFFTAFNQDQCIQREYPTYVGHSGIAGCLFWSRSDYLQQRDGWDLSSRAEKQQENWSYLTSTVKDQLYYSCVNQICPKPSLFK